MDAELQSTNKDFTSWLQRAREELLFCSDASGDGKELEVKFEVGGFYLVVCCVVNNLPSIYKNRVRFYHGSMKCRVRCCDKYFDLRYPLPLRTLIAAHLLTFALATCFAHPSLGHIAVAEVD